TGSLDLTLGQQREMGNFSRDEQHGRGVLACGDAGPAADAGGSVERLVGRLLGDRKTVGVLRPTGIDRDVTARLYYAIEGTPVNNEILHDRKGFGPPRFDVNGLPIFE